MKRMKEPKFLTADKCRPGHLGSCGNVRTLEQIKSLSCDAAWTWPSQPRVKVPAKSGCSQEPAELEQLVFSPCHPQAQGKLFVCGSTSRLVLIAMVPGPHSFGPQRYFYIMDIVKRRCLRLLSCQ